MIWTIRAILVALVIDQLSKLWILHIVDLPNRHFISLIEPILNLQMAWNQGVNFGLLSSDNAATRWIFIGLALAVCLIVVFWVRSEVSTKWGYISAGLLIGGALGNAIDRCAYGAVVDFINNSWFGWQNPFSYNFADVFVFLGVVGLLLFSEERKPKKNKA